MTKEKIQEAQIEEVKIKEIITPKGINVSLVTIGFEQKINWEAFDQLLSTHEFSEIPLDGKITIVIDNTSIGDLFFSLFSGEIKDNDKKKFALESLISKLGPIFGKCKPKSRIIYFYPKRAAAAKVLPGDPKSKQEQGLRHEVTHLRHIPEWLKKHNITDLTVLRNTYLYLCEAILGISATKIALDAVDKYKLDPIVDTSLKIGIVIGSLFIIKHAGFNAYRHLPIEEDAQSNEKAHLELQIFE